MTHLTDDDLVLHYYGEGGRDVVAAGRHLQSCPRCARAYAALARSLDAVTPPEFETVDDLPPLRQLLQDGLREHAVGRVADRSRIWEERAALALVWLVPVAYPVSLQALFDSTRWTTSAVAMVPLVMMALLWACAGPLVAVVSLNGGSADRTERVSTRLLFVGALMATISPALFVLVRRADVQWALNGGVWPWYGVLAVAALVTVVPWPATPRSTRRFAALHGYSAILLAVFVLGHVINQAIAFVSPGSYTAMRSVMRVASQQPITYAVIVLAVAIQIVTGAVTSMKNVRAGALARNLQAVTGWYLAAFLLMHVFSGLIFGAPPATAVAAAPPINPFDLLASPRAVAQLPYLLLGVAAFLFHVGIYARLAALAFMAEASVRRLSYAGALAGATVVFFVGLSLCGIHL